MLLACEHPWRARHLDSVIFVFFFVLNELLGLDFPANQCTAMEVRISRSLLSTYWTLALVLTGFMSPLLGKLYDAAGARMMVAVAGTKPRLLRL